MAIPAFAMFERSASSAVGRFGGRDARVNHHRRLQAARTRIEPRRAAANSAVEFPTSSRRTNRTNRPSAIAASSIKLRGRARVDAAFTLVQLITSFAYPSCWRPRKRQFRRQLAYRATRMMVPLFLPVLRRKSIVTGSFPAKASRRSCSMPSRAGWFWSLRS